MPALVAAGPRRRRRRPVLHVGAPARRLRGQGRDRRGVGRELRRRRRPRRRRTSPFTVATAGDVVTFTLRPDDPRPRDRRHAGGARSTTPRSSASPVRHPFVDEVLYFAIPDRFNDGDPPQQLRRLRRPVRRRTTRRRTCSRTATCRATRATTTAATSRASGEAAVPRRARHHRDLGRADLREQADAVRHHRPLRPLRRATTATGSSTSSASTRTSAPTPSSPQLVDEAHARGIKVFMDIVTNHTADVIQLEGNAGYRNKRDFPYRDVNGAAVRRLATTPTPARPTTRSPRST